MYVIKITSHLLNLPSQFSPIITHRCLAGLFYQLFGIYYFQASGEQVLNLALSRETFC